MRTLIEFVVRGINDLNRATQATQTFQKASAAASRTVGSTINPAIATATGHFSKYAKQVNASAQAQTRQVASADKMRISFLGMLRVMALFAVNLQIIRAIMSPFGFLRNGITQAAELEAGLRKVNVLLLENDRGFTIMRKGVTSVATRYGLELNVTTDAIRNIASSLDSLNRGQLSELESSLAILKTAAKGTLLDKTTVDEVSNALITTMSSMQIPVEKSDMVLGKLFATAQVGRLTFAQINQEIGTFMGTVANVAPLQNIEQRMKFLDDTLVLFAALTNVLPASEAATAENRFLNSFIKESKQARELRGELQKLTGARFDLQALSMSTPVEMVQTLNKSLGVNSPLIADIMAGRKKLATATPAELEAARQSIPTKIAAALFPDTRALRAFLSVSTDDSSALKRVQEGYNKSVANLDKALAEGANSFSQSLKEIKTNISSLAIMLSMPVLKEAGKFLRSMADSLTSVINAPGFEELSNGDKLARVLNSLNTSLDRWWRAGGREKVQDFALTFTTSIIGFIDKAIASNMDKIGSIGESIAKGIMSGMMGYAAKPSTWNPLTSPLVPTLIAKKYLGLGWGGSLGVGIAGQQLLGNTTGTAEGGFDIFGALTNVAMIAAILKGGTGNKKVRDPLTGQPTTVRQGSSTAQSAADIFTIGAAARGLNSIPSSLQNGGVRGMLGRGASAAMGARFMGIPLGALGAGAGAAYMVNSGTRDADGTGGVMQLWNQIANGGALTDANLQRGQTAGAGAIAAARKIGSTGPIFDSIRQAYSGQQSIQSRSLWNPKTIWNAGKSFLKGDFGPNSGWAAGSGYARDQAMGTAQAQFDMSSGSLFERFTAATDMGLKDAKDANGNPLSFGTSAGIGAGAFQEIIKNGLDAGIKTDADMRKYLAFNMAVIAGESGFNAKAGVLNDNGHGWSAGLYQLNQQGQGKGYGYDQLRNDPALNARIGSKEIARLFAAGGGSDLVKLAMESGHPGLPGVNHPDYAGAKGFATRLATYTNQILGIEARSKEFNIVDSGGLTRGGGGINITAQTIVVQDNGKGLRDSFLNATATAIQDSTKPGHAGGVGPVGPVGSDGQ